MKSGLVCLLVAQLFFPGLLRAEAAPVIKASVDKMRIVSSDVITYKIIVSVDNKEAPRLELPQFSGFKVVSSAQSQTVSFGAQRSQTQFVYILILAPEKSGELIIPPAVLKIKNKSLSSEGFTIQVKPGAKVPSSPDNGSPPSPGVTPNQDSSQVTL